MEALIRNLTAKGPLDESAADLIRKKAEVRTVDRGELLLAAGSRCDRIYFVEAGILRSYVIGTNGQERIVMFGFADWWITDIEGFTLRKAASVSIQSLTPCRLVVLRKADIDTLLATSHPFESIWRKMMQYSYIREQRRALELISLEAPDRYQNLLARYPDIEQLISQKHLAQYLGVTPEFLSAMKRRLKP